MIPGSFNQFRRQLASRLNRGPQVFFVTHNRNHVRMFVEAERLLRQWGYRTMFCVPFNFVHAHYAVSELENLGLTAKPINQMIKDASRGDIVVVGLDDTPGKLRDALARFVEMGVHTVGMVEGARFPKPQAFQQVGHVFVWGQSGVDAYGGRAKLVGSVVVEDSMQRNEHSKTSRMALVNYKFTWKDRNRDPDHNWLNAVINICEELGFEPVFSCHPAEQHEIPDIVWSKRTVEELLAESALVVTRSSTLIYQALALGVQPFLYPIAEEQLLELSDPMDAFSICETADDLRESIWQWRAANRPVSGARFLDHHVSVQPGRPAFQRVAEAIHELASEA